MRQAIAFLLRRIDPTKKIVEVLDFSNLQKSMLTNGEPEAFILEPLMTGVSGTLGIQTIKINYPTIPLIIFSSMLKEDAEKSCLQAGANLYIEKTTHPKDLSKIIANYLNWTNILDSSNIPPILRSGLKLSRRQGQLLLFLEAGLSNSDIAKKLEISEHTVKVHLWRFYKKFNVNSRTQLIKIARDNGYLDYPH